MTESGRLLTTTFAPLRALWAGACLVSLVFWYLELLNKLTVAQSALLVFSLLSLSGVQFLLLPRLKHRAGLTMLLSMAELVVLAWLVWLLAS